MLNSPSQLRIDSGLHAFYNCPLIFSAVLYHISAEANLLSDDSSSIIMQRLSNGSVATILDRIDAGGSRVFTVEHTKAASPQMHIVDNGTNRLTVFEGDEVVTEYVYLGIKARPYLFPLHEPGGIGVTRSFPMNSIPNETTDHPHHRSLWFAHGDVNGVDNWSEETGHGHTKHIQFDGFEQGPACAQFRSTGLWTSAAGDPILTQYLTATFWKATDTERLMDFEVTLSANAISDDLVFGDTKEGGILSVRVASSMDVKRGGSISNVYGGIDEQECWGKPSQWCSYTGNVNDQHCGIAIFNHPDSFRAPTTWHVRNYGLMTANPFGYSEFTQGRVNGSYTLRAGDELKFRYRVAVHRDVGFNALCANHFLAYAFPPQATIIAKYE